MLLSMNLWHFRAVLGEVGMVTRVMSDADLVAAAASGDHSAYATLVRLHADAVYAHALRFFGDAPTAEDATQEVFLKVFRSLDGFDGRAQFSTWLYRVTRNVCLDMVRAGKRTPLPLDPVDLEPLPRPTSQTMWRSRVRSKPRSQRFHPRSARPSAP